MAAEPVRVDHRPPQEELVQEPLLQPVRQLREVADVAGDRGRGAEVALRHADLIGGAEDEVVGVGEVALAARCHLRGVAEQAVPVERRARRRRASLDRGARDDAVEVGVPVAVSLRHAVGVQRERATRRAARRQVAGHGHGALHPARYLRILGRGEVLHVGHLELRRGPLHLPVGEVVVAERGEGVVSHVERPLGDVVVAGDREVPGQVEVVALDARLVQGLEDPLEVRAPLVDHGRVGGQPVAVVAESGGRRDRLAAGRLQVAKRDDVAVPGGEVLRRVDQQRGARRARRVGVDLGPDPPPLARIGVDQDDRLLGIAEAADVVDRHGAGALQRRLAVEAGDLDDDRLAGAEAVAGVVRRGVDVDAVDVGRHRGRLEVHPAARRRVGVVNGVVVVREGKEAAGALLGADEVAAIGVAEIDRGRRRRGPARADHERRGGAETARDGGDSNDRSASPHGVTSIRPGSRSPASRRPSGGPPRAGPIATCRPARAPERP